MPGGDQHRAAEQREVERRVTRRPHAAFFSIAIVAASASVQSRPPAPTTTISSISAQQQPTRRRARVDGANGIAPRNAAVAGSGMDALAGSKRGFDFRVQADEGQMQARHYAADNCALVR